MRKFLEDDVTIIFLSTGYRNFPNVDRIANYIAGLVDPDLEDAQVVAGETLTQAFLEKPLSDAMALYRDMKSESPQIDLEGAMNSIGYTLAGRGNYDQAIAVFILNTEENPDSWNVWDSLGEGYEMAGDIEHAIINYEKSVVLNPDNGHGLEKLESLKKD